MVREGKEREKEFSLFGASGSRKRELYNKQQKEKKKKKKKKTHRLEDLDLLGCEAQGVIRGAGEGWEGRACLVGGRRWKRGEEEEKGGESLRGFFFLVERLECEVPKLVGVGNGFFLLINSPITLPPTRSTASVVDAAILAICWRREGGKREGEEVRQRFDLFLRPPTNARSRGGKTEN